MKDESFVCENCGKIVEKLNYTARDHCPYCLYSKHLDINPNLKSTICLMLILLFAVDMVYSHFNPNCGDGITSKVLNIYVNKKDKQIN